MKLTRMAFLLWVLSISGCQSSDDGKHDPAEEKGMNPEMENGLETASNPNSPLSASELSSTASLISRTKEMMLWYVQNESMLSDIHLVDSPDSLRGRYTCRIRQSGVNEHLSLLLKSGFFSEKYVANERAYYRKMDSNLVKSKNVDGPAEGLEYDRVFWTQDVTGDLAMDSLFTYKQVGDTVFVVTPEKTLCFGYDKGKKIQSIEPRFPD